MSAVIYPGKWEELEKIISYLRVYHPEYVMHTDPRCPYVPGEKVVEFLHDVKAQEKSIRNPLCFFFASMLLSPILLLIEFIFSIEITGSDDFVFLWNLILCISLVIWVCYIKITYVPVDVRVAAKTLLKTDNKKIVCTDIPVVVDLYRLAQQAHSQSAWIMYEEYAMKIMESYQNPLYTIPDYIGWDFRDNVKTMTRDAYRTLEEYIQDYSVIGYEKALSAYQVDKYLYDMHGERK